VNVGFFGGTFNPIHFGHLNLAIEILEKTDLDEIWFSVTGLSPFKKKNQSIDIEHRLEMALLALEGFPQFKLLTLELNQEAPSFTYDTIVSLNALYPNVNFNLCLGQDAAVDLKNWYKADLLVQMAPPLIAVRGDVLLSKETSNWRCIPTRRMDISSTDVRQRLSLQKPCDHLVPAKVLDYIRQHELYL